MAKVSKKPTSRTPLLLAVLGLVLILGAVYIVVENPFTGGQAITPTATTAVVYPDIERITPDEASTALNNRQAVFVDTRSEEEYLQASILASKNIPAAEIASRMDELSKDDWIILFCNAEQEETSAYAAMVLKESGFKRVSVIQGGINAWLEAGNLLER